MLCRVGEAQETRPTNTEPWNLNPKPHGLIAAPWAKSAEGSLSQVGRRTIAIESKATLLVSS